MEFLYRGVNEELYKKLNGKIIPKPKKIGCNFESEVCAGDPHAIAGSGVEAGCSITNEVIFHQWEQEGYDTSGISTTPIKDRAKFYALEGKKIGRGYIYTLSVEVLRKESVAIYRVKDHANFPSVPEDDEHILVATNFLEIPSNAIINIELIETY